MPAPLFRKSLILSPENCKQLNRHDGYLSQFFKRNNSHQHQGLHRNFPNGVELTTTSRSWHLRLMALCISE